TATGARGPVGELVAELAINAEEAKSEHVFVSVSSWRRFIGQVCGGAFAYDFVLQPVLAFAVGVASVGPPLPALDPASSCPSCLGARARRCVHVQEGAGREQATGQARVVNRRAGSFSRLP